MKIINYFLQFIFFKFLLFFFKIIGIKLSRLISSKIFQIFGPLFRSKKVTYSNLNQAFKNIDNHKKDKIIKDMWSSYGKILAEYAFIKDFRTKNKNLNIHIEGQEIIDEIKKSNKPAVFISGHFDNFELLAMHIEKSGINLAAIYRPLNNFFLNPTMEHIRKNYICKNQIKKGISGTKEILKYFKSGASVALMIDQRVSQGIKSEFFGKEALTTTIPAQFVKKFSCKVIPIYIERNKKNEFKITVSKPMVFKMNDTIEYITKSLNKVLENMIIKNPNQWIWTHNRYK